MERLTLDLNTTSDRKLLETTLKSYHGRMPVSVPRLVFYVYDLRYIAR